MHVSPLSPSCSPLAPGAIPSLCAALSSLATPSAALLPSEIVVFGQLAENRARGGSGSAAEGISLEPLETAFLWQPSQVIQAPIDGLHDL